MFYIGLDLSGPSNIKDTALVAFKTSRKALALDHSLPHADDMNILYTMRRYRLEGNVVLGIDAPLSYNIGGGDRPADAALRRSVMSAGLKPGSVMAPTMTRMAYLTLRGIAVARLLQSHCAGVKMVEVHPGAAMALRGAPIADVRNYKTDVSARRNLLKWLSAQGLKNAVRLPDPSDHDVAACACALAAWRWHRKETVWRHPAEPPLHPFDYAC